MNAGPSDWIQIQSDTLAAQIDPQGAQLCVLRDAAANDLLWSGDPAIWKGRAPILFPIVGALNGGHYSWRQQRYALPRHGFARDRRFAVVRHNPQEALFRQIADNATLQMYPFRFELEVAFRIEASTLVVQASVRNTGNEPMPASLGFHPAFRWPLPHGAARNEHWIEFEASEPGNVRRLDAAGLLTDVRHPTPVQGKRLKLQDELFRNDVLIFEQLHSRHVIYGAPFGPRLKVSFPDATHLGLWSKPGAGFVCIEPWRGVADPVGYTGSLDDKPGIFQVAPGASQSLLMHIEWMQPA